MDVLNAVHSRVIVARILRDWPDLHDTVVLSAAGQTGATIQRMCIDIALRLNEPGADAATVMREVLDTYGDHTPERALCY